MYAISGSPEYALLSFYRPVSCLSWAPLGGGIKANIGHIINRTLSKEDLKPLPGIISDLTHFIAKLKLEPEQTVAMVTTASQSFLGAAVEKSSHGMKVMVVSTVGLGNIVAPGEHTAYDEEQGQEPASAGTINIVVSVNRNLSPSAAIEFSNSVTLAKASVMADLDLKSRRNSKLCLATGTDCNIVCWNPASNTTLQYAGLHTRLAELTANAVRGAMLKSLAIRLGAPYRTDHEILSLAQQRFSATR